MAHGSTIGRWWNESDKEEATADIYGGMKSDIGAYSSADISRYLEDYEKTGNLDKIPEGRLRDIVKFSSESVRATKGEVSTKGYLADLGVESAETQLDYTKDKTATWLEGNLKKMYGERDKMSLKTGLTGPTRGFDQSRDALMEEKELKDYESVFAGQNVDKAKLQKRLTTFGGQKDIAGAETTKLQQINQVKDLMYEIETGITASKYS